MNLRIGVNRENIFLPDRSRNELADRKLAILVLTLSVGEPLYKASIIFHVN